MAEGLQAGRLDVPVVADLAGFARELRTRVEAAAEGLAVKVKIKVDDKGLRKSLEKAVEKASRGVTATVRVKVDQDRLRTELDGIARTIADTNLNLPVRPDGDGNGSPGGGLLGGLRNLVRSAQGEADSNPVNVPVQMRLPRGRGTMRMLGLGALVSLVQPAVAAIGQYGGALTALVSAAAPAVGVLGAIPGLITGAATAAIGTKVAFSGMGEAIKQSLKAQALLADGGKLTEAQQAKLDEALGKLSKSALKSVTTVTELSGAWRKMRTSVQERFFSKIADDIKPLSNAVLPLLKDTLGDSADQMGSLAERGAQFMQSGVFRKDFKTIAGTNSKVVGNIANGLGNLGRATMDYLVASGPFVERVGKAGEKFTQWLRSSAKAGRETGSLARFLDHAGDKAAQLGRSTGSLIKGLGGVGHAAMDSGNALLDGFEGGMKRFERWANSKPGRRAMEQFFSDAAPAFHEFNALVGDFARGLGKAFKDGGITDLIRQIRTELMPAVGSFFNAIGQSVGPAVISVLSNIATAIANISDAGMGLGVLLVAFSGLLQIFNGIMGVIPGANTALAVLLGTMLALKVVSGVTSMLRGFGTSVAAAGTSLGALGNTMRGSLGPGVIGPQATMWQRMGLAYQGAAQQGGRLTGTMRGLGAANRVASTAMGGMMSALGGPLGLAIAAATIGLGILASKQQASARAAQAHEDRVKSLAQALHDSGGVVDANVRAQAAQVLQDTKLSDGKTKLVDVMRDADVKLGELTGAYLEQDGTIGGLQKKLLALAEANKEYVEKGRDVFVMDYSPQGKRYKEAADALGQVNGELDKTRKNQKELDDAVNGSGSMGVSAYGRLQSAVQGFGDKTKSADERVNSLKRALDALNGNSQSFHDATARLNQQMLTIDDTMAGAIDKTQGWGKALVDAEGLVNTSTRNGQTLNSQLGELHTAMLGVATGAKQASEQGLMPMSEAMDKSQGAMERARGKAIALARDMGLNKDQAKALADQMGFIPDTVTTIMTTNGSVDTVTAEILTLRPMLADLEKDKAIRVKAITPEASAALQTLGFQVQRIPGTKDVEITAKTSNARENVKALAADIAATPGDKPITVRALTAQAQGELKAVSDKVSRFKDKPFTMKALTEDARKALTDLGFKVNSVPGAKGSKELRITAPPGTVRSNVAAIQGAIDSLRGRTIVNTVVTNHESRKIGGSTGGRALANADGGIWRHFANGGIHRAMEGVKSFANGTEKHIAQIAKGGDLRIWAEPETNGEAYIPLARSKRRRSAAILDQVAREFGGRVVYFANGALNRQQGTAPGALRSAPTGGRTVALADSTAGSQGSSALVGGDLNINVGAVATVGDALGDAMYELQRIKLGGSYA